MSYHNLEHPSITRCLATGYPYEEPEYREPFDEDAAHEEKWEREMGWVD